MAGQWPDSSSYKQIFWHNSDHILLKRLRLLLPTKPFGLPLRRTEPKYFTALKEKRLWFSYQALKSPPTKKDFGGRFLTKRLFFAHYDLNSTPLLP